jgi:hopanoid-associated phosphorylase
VITDPESLPPVIAVTGLLAEARIAAGPGVRAITGGGDGRRLRRALEHELARGARAVMSFGIAGGLAEEVTAGAWLVGRAIVTPDARWPCDAEWAAVIVARLPGAVFAYLAGADAPVMHPRAKRALHVATGAAAVDTESHIAAALAAEHALPFATFRVVVDSAWRSLPPVASVALAADGSISRTAVLRSLARAPGQIPSVLRTAVDARRAFRALLRGRRRLGLGFACPDRGERPLDVP